MGDVIDLLDEDDSSDSNGAGDDASQRKHSSPQPASVPRVMCLCWQLFTQWMQVFESAEFTYFTSQAFIYKGHQVNFMLIPAAHSQCASCSNQMLRLHAPIVACIA